jgi:hypothetical protein
MFINKMFSFCCAESRDDIKVEEKARINTIIKRSQNVLNEFKTFETGLKMENAEINKVWVLTKELRISKNELPKKALQGMYNQLKVINLS